MSFTKVVVGEVVECAQHPDAERLKIAKVNVGQEEPLQIVCGAPNCRVGIKVAVALHGAELPSPEGGEKMFKIKKGKLRGVLSQGMLCSTNELGLPDDGIDGIMELPADAMIGEAVNGVPSVPEARD